MLPFATTRSCRMFSAVPHKSPVRRRDPIDAGSGGPQLITDGVAVRLPDGTLAGSVLLMDQAIRNAVEWGTVPQEANIQLLHQPEVHFPLVVVAALLHLIHPRTATVDNPPGKGTAAMTLAWRPNSSSSSEIG